MTFVEGIIDRLAAVADRSQAGSLAVEPAQVAALLSDLSVLAVRGEPAAIRDAQAAVSGLREDLAGGGPAPGAVAELAKPGQHGFLAGALWMASEAMTARLDDIDAQKSQPGRITRRDQVERLCRAALLETPEATPRFIQDSPGGLAIEVKAYELSRAFSDMLARGLIEVVEPPPNSDRRNRYFALTDHGRYAPPNGHVTN